MWHNIKSTKLKSIKGNKIFLMCLILFLLTVILSVVSGFIPGSGSCACSVIYSCSSSVRH